MIDPKYKELPASIKLSAFKEIFSLLSHTISRGYIDTFGVVTGINKNKAYLTKYEVSNPTFLEYFRNTLMDFDDIYTVFKEPKKNIRCTYDGANISSLAVFNDDTDSIVFEASVLHPDAFVVYDAFPSYNNEHIFKESNHIYDLDMNEFAYAITNDYIYRCNHYVITKEAVPKPNKIIEGIYCISDTEDTDISFIYYTTKFRYPDVKLTIASKVINLD